MTELPLSGITVVSLEQAVAAPYATRQLADFGARVIKVERPDGGDFARGYDDSVLGQASYFVWLNRSKESLALDLKDERAMAVLHELLEQADVFVENLGPGATGRLGLSAAELHARYPDLIVCEISGYGADGPWADRKAYDLLVQCETGLVSITGKEDVVARVGISVADIAAGSHAHSGILTALFRRATTGQVSSVQVSLFDALTEWMGGPDYFTMYSGKEMRRLGVEHATISPYGLFHTSDGGAVVLAIQNEREWASFCEVLLGDESLAADPRFCNNAARLANRDVVHDLVAGAIGRHDGATASALLEQAVVADADVNTVAEAAAHPVLSERDRWREVATPAGSIRGLLPPAVLSGIEAKMDAVPALGAHTSAILSELGRTAEEIETLAREGVVGVASHRAGTNDSGGAR